MAAEAVGNLEARNSEEAGRREDAAAARDILGWLAEWMDGKGISEKGYFEYLLEMDWQRD